MAETLASAFVELQKPEKAFCTVVFVHAVDLFCASHKMSPLQPYK